MRVYIYLLENHGNLPFWKAGCQAFSPINIFYNRFELAYFGACYGPGGMRHLTDNRLTCKRFWAIN
jgi:hypothetical protein